MSAKDAKVEFTPATGLLLRVTWIALGTMALIACAIGLATRAGDAVIWQSALYWMAVALIVAARYADIRYYDGQTINAEPADLGHWKRHTIVFVPVAMVLWVVAAWAGS